MFCVFCVFYVRGVAVAVLPALAFTLASAFPFGPGDAGPVDLGRVPGHATYRLG